jgi:hypothetical protein
MLGATDRESECSLNTRTELQDVSSMLSASDTASLLNMKSRLETDAPSERSLVKSNTFGYHNCDKATNATSLLATLDVGDGKLSTGPTAKECVSGCETSQSSIEKPCVVKAECPSCDSIKTSSMGMKSLSKSFSWSSKKFGSQNSKIITSLDRAGAVMKDFKNPFKKTSLSPKDDVMLQVTDGTCVMEASTSASLPLTMEEEEAVVDDPVAVDSELELGPLATSHQKVTSSAASDVSAYALLYSLCFLNTTL